MMTCGNKFLSRLGIFAAILMLCGCAAKKPNIALSQRFWVTKKLVTVTIAKKPEPQLYMKGSQGLLDIVISDAVMGPFSQYLNNFKLNSFDSIQYDFATRLQQYHILAPNYQGIIDLKELPKIPHQNTEIYAVKDFRSLAKKAKSDLLLVININLVGAMRPYYSMIPLGPPVAICNAEGQLISLKDNKLLWRFTTIEEVSVNGEWDQPTNYPGFTLALNNAIQQAKQSLLDNFFYAAPNQK